MSGNDQHIIVCSISSFCLITLIILFLFFFPFFLPSFLYALLYLQAKKYLKNKETAAKSLLESRERRLKRSEEKKLRKEAIARLQAERAEARLRREEQERNQAMANASKDGAKYQGVSWKQPLTVNWSGGRVMGTYKAPSPSPSPSPSSSTSSTTTSSPSSVKTTSPTVHVEAEAVTRSPLESTKLFKGIPLRPELDTSRRSGVKLNFDDNHLQHWSSEGQKKARSNNDTINDIPAAVIQPKPMRIVREQVLKKK